MFPKQSPSLNRNLSDEFLRHWKRRMKLWVLCEPHPEQCDHFPLISPQSQSFHPSSFFLCLLNVICIILSSLLIFSPPSINPSKILMWHNKSVCSGSLLELLMKPWINYESWFCLWYIRYLLHFLWSKLVQLRFLFCLPAFILGSPWFINL